MVHTYIVFCAEEGRNFNCRMLRRLDKMALNSDMKEKLLHGNTECGPHKSMEEGKGLIPAAAAATAAAVAGQSSTFQDRSQGSGRLQLAGSLISLSSFLWGYSVSVLNVCLVNNAKGSLLVDINLTTDEQETATALVLVGAALAALTTGGWGSKLGYRRIILCNNVLYIVGGVLCALATTKKQIFGGRFCIGCVM